MSLIGTVKARDWCQTCCPEHVLLRGSLELKELGTSHTGSSCTRMCLLRARACTRQRKGAAGGSEEVAEAILRAESDTNSSSGSVGALRADATVCDQTSRQL